MNKRKEHRKICVLRNEMSFDAAELNRTLNRLKKSPMFIDIAMRNMTKGKPKGSAEKKKA